MKLKKLKMGEMDINPLSDSKMKNLVGGDDYGGDSYSATISLTATVTWYVERDVEISAEAEVSF